MCELPFNDILWVEINITYILNIIYVGSLTWVAYAIRLSFSIVRHYLKTFTNRWEMYVDDHEWCLLGDTGAYTDTHWPHWSYNRHKHAVKIVENGYRLQ